jgi:hypothetical protein
MEKIFLAEGFLPLVALFEDIQTLGSTEIEQLVDQSINQSSNC